jgi:hypothetical protein
MRTIIIFGLFLSACVEVKDLNDENLHEGQKGITYEMLELTQVNRFKLFLKFNRSGQVLIRKNEASGERLAIAVGETYEDQNITAGETYVYQVGSVNRGQFEIEEEIKIRVPFDLYLNGVLSVDSDRLAEKLQHIRKMHLSAGAVLVTNGRNISIRAEELTSDGGRIVTFEEGQTAVAAQAGRGGGSLSLEAIQARGHLQVFLRGEKGGAGSPGASNNNGFGGKGQRGSSGGESGSLFVGQVDDLKIETQVLPGDGGEGGLGGWGFARCRLHCDASAMRLQGSQGEKGEPGKSGKICFVQTKVGC